MYSQKSVENGSGKVLQVAIVSATKSSEVGKTKTEIK